MTAKIDTTLRQWCEVCQKATITWMDYDGPRSAARCRNHEPPDRREAWDLFYMDED